MLCSSALKMRVIFYLLARPVVDADNLALVLLRLVTGRRWCVSDVHRRLQSRSLWESSVRVKPTSVSTRPMSMRETTASIIRERLSLRPSRKWDQSTGTLAVNRPVKARPAAPTLSVQRIILRDVLSS